MGSNGDEAPLVKPGAAVKTPRVRLRRRSRGVTLTLSFQHTDVTESPSTDRSHSLVTCEEGFGFVLLEQISPRALDHKRPPHLAGAGTPQVDAGSQAHAQQVARRPVYQVEVEVVLQLRGVQHFERDLRDLASWFPRRA